MPAAPVATYCCCCREISSRVQQTGDWPASLPLRPQTCLPGKWKPHTSPLCSFPPPASAVSISPFSFLQTLASPQPPTRPIPHTYNERSHHFDQYYQQSEPLTHCATLATRNSPPYQFAFSLSRITSSRWPTPAQLPLAAQVSRRCCRVNCTATPGGKGTCLL